MNRDIMSISRLRMATDGKGITTLVGFYGCPLDCKYCLNRQCHGETVRGDYTAEELISVLAKDESYYLMTGGGVTFGGGEPLLQSKFIHEVCGLMNKEWNRIIETSLYVPWENIELLLEDIDYWYVDIKDVRPEIYKEYTGGDNRLVLDNLKRLVEAVDAHKVCVRIPFIPGFNTQESTTQALAYVMENISAMVDVEVFDYIRC